jgi:hypothetical protein
MSITDDLIDKGITVRYRRNIHEYTSNTRCEYTFDDEAFPKLNVLYIHLIGNEYYSDDIYTKRKTERERYILFLLAAKLGVHTITYKTDIVNISLKKVNVKAMIKQVKLETTYSKTMTDAEGQSGQETYINRGAPIYSLSENVNQIEANIKERFSVLDCKAFSYDFYRQSAKLRTFVYKRFNFKMRSVEYTNDLEYDLDLSFGVRATLLDYGIGVQLDEHIITCERINYKLEFYEDRELRLKLGEIMHFEQDPFAIIREVYDAEEKKDIAIYHITEYVRKYSKSCILVYFKKRTKEQHLRDNYYDRLNHWIKNKGIAVFEKECHKFTSSYQIRTWFKEVLIYGDEEVEEVDDDEDDICNYGVLKLKKTANQEYKQTIMKTDNYATVAADTFSNTASQYPTQYQYNASTVSQNRLLAPPSKARQARNSDSGYGTE